MYEWIFQDRPCNDCAYMTKHEKKKQTGGSKAATHGAAIEDMIQATIDNVKRMHPNISYWRPHAMWNSTPEKVFARDPEGNVINVDFVVSGLPTYRNRLAIESKFQSVSGSGDEKPEHLVANILNSFPCPAIVILTFEARNGSTPGVQRKFDTIKRRYLRLLNDHIADCSILGCEQKFVGVLTVSQFPRWLYEEADK